MVNGDAQDPQREKPVFKEGDGSCDSCGVSLFPDDIPKPMHCTFPKYCGGL
jgi:hypothetical protein